MQRDVEAREAALRLKDRARYAEAVVDSDRSFPKTLKAYSCAMGMDVSEKATPRLARLLNKMRIDVRHAAGGLRDRYKRKQPFAVYNTPTCSPEDEALVSSQGSYPSARSAVGWSYALVLAELNSERAAEILQRGRDFGKAASFAMRIGSPTSTPAMRSEGWLLPVCIKTRNSPRISRRRRQKSGSCAQRERSPRANAMGLGRWPTAEARLLA